ncbi:GH92 family glycosyl hydrolase [Reichenbachiella ulvae]|uniref:GH92 family glycosyl hydrolase n=1 Tax=Reichenbachiella ulvae TaxID=2980104 RepID=A0ABT3CP71_9BACT|nr:GH92 family glycosyl hydrolase [Reichenbachiella ulvae]MCV9385260.1 GH92 family glycosyl hydrolase [Reichenbachiella ulvae]
MKEKIAKWGLISILLLLIIVAYIPKSDTQKKEDISPVDHVNPYIGNISHLLVPTFPTIHLPNSMLRVYPERRDFTGDRLSGLPLVVTGHRRSSAFNLSPVQKSKFRPVIDYSYDNECIRPYEYQVYLDEENIKVDYSLSHQSGMYSLKFENEDSISLIVNSRNGAINWSMDAISGHQLIENGTKIYLYLLPERMPSSVQTLRKEVLKEGYSSSGNNACLVLKFPVESGELNLRYGISFISTEQAKRNLEREIIDKDIATIKSEGKQKWSQALGKIEVEGTDADALSVFYTSLYRTFERPICLSEDGRYYSAFDDQVHEDNGRPFYTDDWIWDSYRAHHPLNALIDTKKEEDILNSFVLMAEQMDRLWMPTFPEVSGDSRRMNSNHGVAAVLDAHRKGLKNFDIEKAYLAAKGAITEKTLAPWSGVPAGRLDAFYKENGYFPALPDGVEETEPEVHSFESRQPVAVTLGTSYDEWCLSQLAYELDEMEDYELFVNHSYNYRNLYNSETMFFHPKDEQGRFITPFDYKFSGGMGARKFYGENNAWVYRWDVQHNVEDLIELMGGTETFITNLDQTFNEPLGRSKFDFYAQLPDHTGNVGQFSMANEPSLHIPYLYNYAGQPWKTQKRIRTLLDQWFRNDLMGVPGDEDGGGMTSFVVFSQLGFYPVTPGLPIYNIGSPVFEEAKINLPNGNTFVISAENYDPEHKFIQSATLNGEVLDRPWITHEEVIKGGELKVVMGMNANKKWAADLKNVPPSGLTNTATLQ